MTRRVDHGLQEDRLVHRGLGDLGLERKPQRCRPDADLVPVSELTRGDGLAVDLRPVEAAEVTALEGSVHLADFQVFARRR